MKRKIISGLKIYAICLVYILITAFVYSFYLMKTNHNSNKIAELVLGITAFILLGVLYGNLFHKRGLIVGLAVGVLHILIISLVFFLSTGKFEFKPLPTIIYIISSALGGVLGITFKKVI